ncbi:MULTISPECIES: hypothetical protein [unclassified Microcoleus]|uniref:hypothetical protein n=1 Tax=unclassified Microcoleus TaxID=2642155 RepID=UPI0025DA20E4|nr:MULTISPECIES: hypothetical protein [unclassified Microcoleus]
MVEIDFAALRTAANVRGDCCIDDGNVLAGGNQMNGKPQRLLLPATLTEEDEFYAECSAGGIKNFVDRVNGKPVRAYPYWIDRPNCNWKAPVQEEYQDGDEYEG